MSYRDYYAHDLKKKRNSKCTDNNTDESYYYEEDKHEAEIVQDANQATVIEQESNELIWIKESCNVSVQTTDTQAAISLQVALQLAIALVLRLTIGSSDDSEGITEDLLQHFDTEQTNKQKIIINNSKDVDITTTDTDVSVSIQALLQVLLTLVAKLEIA
ncbi:spore coat protein [Priestia megaterium]|uniref:spore coat protein n=1 Tax=Priestia megaterium TaxID=1404 RepID=UPI002042492D|nr:spore coat protein [Priestia megaterium]MCM3197176.1 spore coat protein [Priestia megaterium]